MISNFDKNSSKNARNLILIVVTCIVLLIWFLTPPANKIVQICYWGNNIGLYISKLVNAKIEYMFYRNNAIMLVKMYPKDEKQALKEIDKAIVAYPSGSSINKLSELRKDKAVINMYYGNYYEALVNYLNSGSIVFNDYIKIAVLYNELGQYDKAMSYCNEILNHQDKDFLGYACLANVYKTQSKLTEAKNIWEDAIFKKTSSAQSYAERGKINRLMGNTKEADSDFTKAKKLNPAIKLNESPIDDILHPKTLPLPISFAL